MFLLGPQGLEEFILGKGGGGGRGLLQEHVLALLPMVAPVRDQVKILKDALAGIVQVVSYQV